MDEHLNHNLPEVAVPNAIGDLKRAKLSNQASSNNNPSQKYPSFEADDINCNTVSAANGFSDYRKPLSQTMRMASPADVMTNSCSESEAEEPLEFLDQQPGNGSGDEGSWLYQSPGSRSVAVSTNSNLVTPVRAGDDRERRRQKSSPLDWLRRDFDQTPSPDVQKARYSLVNKLDEITKEGKASPHPEIQLRRGGGGGRVDSQTFRIRDSRNQVRRSLQELINVSGPHTATGTQTQTTSHECQTEDAGMQTSWVDDAYKPKIVGSQTVTRSAGRRIQPSLRPNPPAVGDQEESTSSTPNPPTVHHSEGQSQKVQPQTRAGPVVWENSAYDNMDMIDLQVIARMQEDSLRKSVVVSRKNDKPGKLTGIVQPLSLQNGTNKNHLDIENTLPTPHSKYGLSKRTGATDDAYAFKPPRIGREGSASSMQSMDSSHGNNGSDSMSIHSVTPPDSPLGGSRPDLNSASRLSGLSGLSGPSRRRGAAIPAAVTRRSLPNLAQTAGGLSQHKPKASNLQSSRRKMESPLKSHTSDSNLQEKSGLRQPTVSSRLKPPSSSLRAPSPAGASARSTSPGIPRGVVPPTPRSIPSRGGSSIARPGGRADNPTGAAKTRGIPRAGAQLKQPLISENRRSGIQARGSRTTGAEWEDDYY